MLLQKNTITPLPQAAKGWSINEVLADLKTRGYRLMFRREPTCLYCIELNRWIKADNFIVDECYHFEDAFAPDMDRLLYAISSTQNIKGFLVETNFVYQDSTSLEMAQKLQFDYSLPVETYT